MPVAIIYVLASALYAWQASRHPTPWLFSDEIEYTQIARAIAETGEPARRGVEYWGAGLYPWLQAPFWWIDDVGSAYEAIKTVQALVMSLVVVPAYLLARLVVDRPWALLAAAGAAVSPAFVYAPMLIQEPVAYPYAALCFLVIARALVRPTRGSIAVAVVLCVIAPLIRDQLILLPMVLALAAGITWSRGERATGLRDGWRWPHWLGAVGVLVLAAVVLGLLAGTRSVEWDVASDDPLGIVEQAAWALGAFAVGLGVLPFVALFASLVPAPGLPRSRQHVALHAILCAAVLAFVAYAGAKGVYGAVTFEPRIVERNLIYLTPLAWVALAMLLRFRTVHIAGLLGAAVVTAYAITETPFALTIRIYADAPGTAVLTTLHEIHGFGVRGVDTLLAAMLAVSVVVLLLPRLVPRRKQVVAVVTAVAAACALGWGLWAETSAADASNDFSGFFAAGLPKPRDWVERKTGGASTVYIGQKIADPNGIWSLEFWNPSVKQVWSLDGSAPGPGPTLTPNLADTDGLLEGDPGYPYAVGDFGVQLAGDAVDTNGAARLYRVGDALRLHESTRGVFIDGWVGSSDPASEVRAEYNHFNDENAVPGTLLVTVARKGWCSPRDVPGRVLIEVGPTALGPEFNGVVGTATERRGWEVLACSQRTFPIPTPAPPFSARVTIAPPFQPNALDPEASTDRRYLGAQLGFQWVPSTP